MRSLLYDMSPLYCKLLFSQFTGDGDKYADTIALAVDAVNKRVSNICVSCVYTCMYVCKYVCVVVIHMYVL